jgi:23S rRNA A2030 N6-methylase RlmJ
MGTRVMTIMAIQKQGENPQIGNVGNFGDILKHAMLISLLNLAVKHSSKEIVYIDTHAFKLFAPCTKPDVWIVNVNNLMRDFNQYEIYFELEKQVLKQRPYRCSAGLALDILNISGRKYSAFLGENDSQTRNELRQQLEKESQKRCRIISKAEYVENLQLPADVNTVFILVDPFELKDVLWNTICIAINKFRRLNVEVIVQVFTYNKDTSAMRWPGASLLTKQPTATISRLPYHLSVYSSKALSKEVKQCGQVLGWEV